MVEELVEEAREVRGKAGILFRVAEAAVGRPEGVVREVIFPVVGEQTFEALVREARALGTPQNRRVHTAVRASYGSYYRRMMPRLLAALEFRCNKAQTQHNVGSRPCMPPFCDTDICIVHLICSIGGQPSTSSYEISRQLSCSGAATGPGIY